MIAFSCKYRRHDHDVHFEVRRPQYPRLALAKTHSMLIVEGTLHRGPIGYDLFDSQPVADPHTQPTHSLHTANASSQFRAQQPGIGGFVGNPADGREA